MINFSFSFSVKNNFESVVAEGYFTPATGMVCPKIPRGSKTFGLVKQAVDFTAADRAVAGCTLENGWTVTRTEIFTAAPEVDRMHELTGYDA